MTKKRKSPKDGEILAVPLSGGKWVYVCCFGPKCRLYKHASKGIIKKWLLTSSRDWLTSFVFLSYEWSFECKTVGQLEPKEVGGNYLADWPEFYLDRGPEYGDKRYEHISFNSQTLISWDEILKKKLPPHIHFSSITDLRDFLETLTPELVWLEGEPVDEKPLKKEHLDVTLELRNVLPVYDKTGLHPGGYLKGLAEKRAQSTKFDQDKELEDRFARLVPEIRKFLRDGEYDAQLVEILVKEDKLRIQAPVSEVKSLISFLRRQFICDAYDHWNYSYLEIEQRGPALGEWKIFGSKGPAREESSPDDTVKGPVFDAGGLDETTYAPFLVSIHAEEAASEVRLELGDFSLLEETLELEDGFETDGNALGDAMLADIEKLQLVRKKDGTHAGGVFDNCEGDTVLFHFNSVEDAVRVAEHFLGVFTDKKALRKWVKSHKLLS